MLSTEGAEAAKPKIEARCLRALCLDALLLFKRREHGGALLSTEVAEAAKPKIEALCLDALLFV